MKFILLFAIKLYWFLIPENKRRKCIFKTSCSNHIYDKTKKNGIINGLKELNFRIRNCHPKFDIYTDYKTGLKKMILRTGVIVDENEISERLK